QAGRLDEAAEARREAQAVWLELVTEFNHEDRRVHLAWTLEALADIDQRAGRPEDSAEGYAKAIDVWEKLAADFPRQAQYAANQGDRLLLHARLLRGLGKQDDAEADFRRAWSVYARLVEAQPDSWTLLAQRASVSAELGEWENAARDFEKAVE